VIDVEGKGVVGEGLDTWKPYSDKLSNEKFICYKHSLSDVGRVRGPSERILVADVKAAIAKIMDCFRNVESVVGGCG